MVALFHAMGSGRKHPAVCRSLTLSEFLDSSDNYLNGPVDLRRVVKRPTERRTVPRAHSTGTFIACRTEEIFGIVEWHAEPVEAATS